MDNTIGERLAYLRKQHNLTQNDLALQLQVTYQAISKWERNENLPDVFTLQKIAQIYNISVDELLGNQPLPIEGKPVSMAHNIIKVIAILLILISPLPYLTRAYTDTLGGILGSAMTFIIGFILLLFLYLERNRTKE